MAKTSKAQLEATKKYLKNKDVLKVTFDKGTRECLEMMVTFAKDYYLHKCKINTVQDFIRYAVTSAMEEITLYYGEITCDAEIDGLNLASLPNADQPQIIVECVHDNEENSLYALNSYVVDKEELQKVLDNTHK